MKKLNKKQEQKLRKDFPDARKRVFARRFIYGEDIKPEPCALCITKKGKGNKSVAIKKGLPICKDCLIVELLLDKEALKVGLMFLLRRFNQ